VVFAQQKNGASQAAIKSASNQRYVLNKIDITG
jgi:hypothetical protein